MYNLDGHYQAPKHAVVPYVENTLYSTNKYSCVRRVHTLYISYWITKATDTRSENVRFLLFHSTKGYANALQFYIYRQMPILFIL